MAEEKSELRELLVRIDERVKIIQEDIAELNAVRRCHTYAAKFRKLERTIWAVAAVVTGIAVRVAYEAFK